MALHNVQDISPLRENWAPLLYMAASSDNLLTDVSGQTTGPIFNSQEA
jgi:hypothetical protein